MATSLPFLTMQIEENVSRYLLVIDANGDGTFLLEHTKYIKATDLKDNTLIFTNVKWDEDGSGSDIFTFTLKPELKVTLENEKPIICNADNNGILHYNVGGGISPFSYELIKDGITLQQWRSSDDKYPGQRIEHLGEGEYTLRVTDALGTQREVHYSLANPVPISVNLGEDRQFSLDQQKMTLDATVLSSDEMIYRWNSDSGFTSDSPKVTITTPGVYTVTVTSSKGCEATDSIKIELNFIQSFIVFPNQSQDGHYNIQIKLEEWQDVTIQVFDMVGRHISTVNGKNKSAYTIAGKRIPSAGLYNVVLQSADIKATVFNGGSLLLLSFS